MGTEEKDGGEERVGVSEGGGAACEGEEVASGEGGEGESL